MKYLLVSAMIALTSQSAFAASQAEQFEKLNAQDALEQSHQWHRTGEATVKVFPDFIEAEFADKSTARIPTGDQFLLSIAPFENMTHGCTFHVPTGCQGEMVEKSMMVEITDSQTNEVVQAGMVRTQKDGFIDFWVPKNGSYKVSFNYQGKTATEVLTTDSQSRTCITTMQLL
ncbi:hypothetical protein C9I98_15170 [Photobacterium sanctipauli]|uniref:Uncharacterized protein n=1 Tax=Photobacterium sanctipauli TaxID=1342794 RepID=A0A2T3NRD3_9GAMM|nr:CueP family metal-binding protein [Photobacterium sanctipauli]PSW18808.1 hypothetical protein C9I98_15170 [Photobacterium sanctipauli]